MVKEIASAIREGIKYLTLLSKTSHVRRLRKAVDYGEQFILRFGELTRESNVKRKKKIRNRMDLARKRFFKYNQ